MPKLPHPDDHIPPERGAESMFIEVAVDATPEIKEHIRHADYWSADWRLRELEFEQEPRWSCPAYVPVFQLIYAAFRSNAKGLLLFSDEWRRREL